MPTVQNCISCFIRGSENTAGFEAASTPGIWSCAGAFDGILIWMLKPSLKEATHTGVDQKKYHWMKAHVWIELSGHCRLLRLYS